MWANFLVVTPVNQQLLAGLRERRFCQDKLWFSLPWLLCAAWERGDGESGLPARVSARMWGRSAARKRLRGGALAWAGTWQADRASSACSSELWLPALTKLLGLLVPLFLT